MRNVFFLQADTNKISPAFFAIDCITWTRNKENQSLETFIFFSKWLLEGKIYCTDKRQNTSRIDVFLTVHHELTIY